MCLTTDSNLVAHFPSRVFPNRLSILTVRDFAGSLPIVRALTQVGFFGRTTNPFLKIQGEEICVSY